MAEEIVPTTKMSLNMPNDVRKVLVELKERFGTDYTTTIVQAVRLLVDVRAAQDANMKTQFVDEETGESVRIVLL